MKIVTNEYKQNIKANGREIDAYITYDDKKLTTSEINEIVPSFNADILKSAMKGVEIDSNILIPQETIINVKFGVKVNNEYEYIDYGNYIVKKAEYNADTLSYKITCYDKIMLSMVDVDDEFIRNLSYPITIKDYLTSICEKIGLKLVTENFVNSNTLIKQDIHSGIGYTYRDILDEIAQVTGSIICVDGNDNLEVRYPKETNEVIDEHYFNETNVTIGEKYGPINALVFSRVADSDTINRKNEESINLNGLTEIKIKDNQILSTNDRSDFIDELFSYLDGLEYYTCNFDTIGITFLELADMYIASIDNKTYPMLMLNDETPIGQGLSETIYTNKPNTDETNYKTSDSTDKKINQTYILVDKQNQKIESVVSDVNNQNEKISQVTQTVDEINQKIQNIADITVSDVTLIGHLELNGINESEPINIIIRPLGEDISYLYPHSNLFPSEKLYIKTRTLRFHNKTTNEIIDYELPEDLLYYDSDTYSEFRLDYDTQTCEVVKRVEYNEDGTKSPITTKINPYPYPPIRLTDGDYEISLLGYNSAYLSVRLMASNIYTSQFATRIELKSSITQTENSINQMVQAQITGVDNKITDVKGEVSLKLNTKDLFSEFNVNVNQVVINSDNFKVSREGNITANSGNIGGFVLNSTSFSKKISGLYDYDSFDLLGTQYAILNDKTINDSGFNPYDTNGDGKIDIADLLAIRKKILGDGTINKTVSGSFEINSNNPKYCVTVKDHNNNLVCYMGLNGINSTMISCENLISSTSNTDIYVTINGKKGIVSATNGVNQGSREEIKKNFEKFTGALKIIDDIDLYKYNFKNEEDNHKKHIGFVIGNNYKYSSEITAIDESGKEIGVDLYSMASLCLEAIKELYEIIKEEKNEK